MNILDPFHNWSILSYTQKNTRPFPPLPQKGAMLQEIILEIKGLNILDTFHI